MGGQSPSPWEVEGLSWSWNPSSLTWLRWSRGWSPRLDTVEPEGERPCSGLGGNWTRVWSFFPHLMWSCLALARYKLEKQDMDSGCQPRRREEPSIAFKCFGFLKKYFYWSQMKNNTTLTSPKIIWWPDGVIPNAIQEQLNIWSKELQNVISNHCWQFHAE